MENWFSTPEEVEAGLNCWQSDGFFSDAVIMIDYLEKNFIHIYLPLRSGRIWHKVNFLAEFNRFEFRVFLPVD